MAVNFEPLGVTDDDVGMIGFVSTLGMCVVASVVAYAQDSFRDKIKISLAIMQVIRCVLMCAKMSYF